MTHNNQILFRSGWDEFNRLRREMSELFSYGSNSASRGIYDRSIAPPVNIAETTDAFHVQVELPGMKNEEIDLTVNNDVLTIKGERKAFTVSKGIKTFRVEIPGGAFQKTLPLPRTVDSGRIKADLSNGILIVTLPKKEEVKPRQITVNKG